jgi:hypothetical protein
VAGADAAVVLQAAEHHLDAPALGVADAVVPGRPLAMTPAGNDRLGAGRLQIMP